MEFRNLLLLAISIFTLNACLVGDSDDVEIIYQPTLIELVCQTPEISNFCDLMYRTRLVSSRRSKSYGQPIAAWEVQFAGRSGGFDPITGVACASNVETIFAPSNKSFGEYFLSVFPRWVNLSDTTLNFTAIDASIAADSSASDSITNIVLHHMYNINGQGRGAKLYVEIEDPECTEMEIVRGNQVPYIMMDQHPQGWVFINTIDSSVAALSQATSYFSIIEAPDMATTDGAVYILDRVLGPYFQ